MKSKFMKLFATALVVVTLAVVPLFMSGCAMTASACSSLCKVGASFIPAGGTATVISSMCDSAPASWCNEWVSNKLDSLGVVQWLQQRLGKRLSEGQEALQKAKATSISLPALLDGGK